MRQSTSVTVTLDLPALDDATAVEIYNFLCDLIDRFDAHYGEQICRFYSARDPLTHHPPITDSDIPF